MAQFELGVLKDTSNPYILNAIRKLASTDYQNRVPDATKASMQQMIQHLTNQGGTWNEFTEALINRIGLVFVKNQIWSNPLARFKRGMLEYGDTIEEINVGLIRARVFNPDRIYLEKDIFGNYPPDVQASYHKIDRQVFYPISVNEDLLKRAFLSENGLADFINSTMTAPATSDQWDEFLQTCQLFREYYDNQGFFTVKVADLSSSTVVADAQYFLRKVRELTGKLQFVSSYYNAAGMPVSVNKDDLELFITPEAMANLDVDALAGAFNIDHAQMSARINLIPQENFNIVGAQAILTTRDFFVIADARIENTSIYNPVSLNNNFFMHHWEVISASRFVPAILFSSTDVSSVINIVNTPVTSIGALTVADPGNGNTIVTTVNRGQLYQVLSSGAITSPTGGANDAVALSVIATPGNATLAALSSKTYVTPEGVLHVGYDEPNEGITVQVIAVDNNTVLATEALTVSGSLLTLWPSPSVLTDNDADAVLEPNYPASIPVDATTGNAKIPYIKGNVWTRKNSTGIAFTDTGDLVTIPNHQLAVGDTVVFGTITGTTGVTAGTTYYVISVVDANTVTISATKGGALLALTTNGTAAFATMSTRNNMTLNIATGQSIVVQGTPQTGYEFAAGVTGTYTLTH